MREQKPSLRQRQCASVRIAQSLARFLLYSAQVIFTLKTRQIRTQTTIPCDDLFGGACYARKAEDFDSVPGDSYVASLL